MNIFNYLSNILFTKKDASIKAIDQQSDYQPFLINRWCSMLNKQTCHVINTTVNTMYQVFESKSDHYKFLHYIVPRERFTRINYIKKHKTENKDSQIVSKLAKNLELSKREINLYKEQLNLDLSKYDQPTKS